MNKFFLKHVSFFVVLTSLFVGHANAEGKLSQVKIEGNQRIESDTILSYLGMKPGDEIDQSKVDTALKELFATGYFNDVNLRLVDRVLRIKVDENPIINRIAFEGNEKLKDETIKEEVRLRVREVLTRSKVQEAQQRLLEIYRRMGRFGAKVEPKIIKLPENRVDLVFEINEGNVSYIRKINFIGNKSFSGSKLEQQLKSKRTRWYRFFATDDVYDPDRFNNDQTALRQFYNDQGFADFRIISAVAELSQDQKDFYMTFTVDEGDLFNFGKVQFTTKLKNVDVKKLREKLKFSEGDLYSARLVDDTVIAIIEAVGSKGYAFVAVEPQLEKDRQKKIINITFDIKEGARVYVEKIVFVGNDVTRDEVLRRELEIHEGDAYNAEKIKRAEHALKELNYFKSVAIETEPGSAPDQARLIVKVQEQQTSEVRLAGGYSTLDGVLGTVGFTMRNFRGAGQILHGEVSIAKKRQDFDIGIIEPYFLGRKLTASADLFHIRSSRFDTFTQITRGTNLGMGYDLSEHWSQNWTYGFKHDRVGHVDDKASLYIKQQKGNYYNSEVGHAIAYDRRDSRIETTRGYIFKLSNSYAGVGGNVKYLRNELTGSWFHPIFTESVFRIKGSVGGLEKVSSRKSIRIVDSFFLGADSFRGFEYGGLGPRDISSNDSARDSIGATRYWTGTIETLFPLGLPSEFGVKGSLFTDFGTAWRPGMTAIKGAQIVDKRSLRAAVGFGLAMQLPIGPMRIDYAVPVKKEKFDRTQRILLSFSTAF